MATKAKKVYVCSACGEEAMTWQGRCPVCQAWNTMTELNLGTTTKRGAAEKAEAAAVRPLDVAKIASGGRIVTGIGEFDRVLGGGFVPGSIILIGGDPGIGKSTLLLQVANRCAERGVIYFSGEESEYQVADRARRLGLAPSFNFANETHVPTIEATILREQPELVIVDSIQTLYDDRLPSTPGSLVQVRESALRLQELAKKSNTIIILIGHVTKEGTVAGPRTLEHMVDAVLYLEGDRRSDARIIRGIKNRFGATYEIGLFKLGEKGMEEIANPSVLFMAEHIEPAPGTILTATIDGARPIVVEIQALVAPTSFGYPKRTATGIDLNRLHLLLAIMTNRAGLSGLATSDVFINVVGGYAIHDRATDLAICLALASGLTNKALPSGLVAYGEVDLTGQIRPVTMGKQRRNEAERLGLGPVLDDVATVRQAIGQYGLTKAREHASG